MPEKRFLAYPELPKAAGSVYLNERLKRIRPDIHIFGHIHFGWCVLLILDLADIYMLLGNVRFSFYAVKLFAGI